MKRPADGQKGKPAKKYKVNILILYCLIETILIILSYCCVIDVHVHVPLSFYRW